MEILYLNWGGGESELGIRLPTLNGAMLLPSQKMKSLKVILDASLSIVQARLL